MIWCVTLNPAWDVTMHLTAVRGPEGVRTADWTVGVAGGKGNNVARVLRALDTDAAAVGIYAGETGALVRAALAREQIELMSEEVPGNTRLGLTLLDAGRKREIRGAGPTVSPDVADRLLERLAAKVVSTDAVVLSGSLPPGLGSETVATWITRLKPRVAMVAADVAGEVLRSAWEAEPSVLAPNAAEYRELCALDPRGSGPDYLVVTRGASGQSWRPRGGRWRRVAPVPAAAVVNTTGAGDAWLGGLVAALTRGCSFTDALALAARVGAASVETAGVAVIADARQRELRAALDPGTG